MSAKKKKKKGRIAIFIIEILLLVVVLVGLYVWSKYQRMDHGAKLDTEDLINEDLSEETQKVLEGYSNIALFGLDNRSNGNFESGNSDAIIIASINNDTKEVKLLSVYRDTYLNMADDGTYSFRKANYAYNKGGPQAAIQMLNRNLDLDIQHYAVVDFQALTETIDLLGGIEVEIDDQMMKWINTYINETASIIDTVPDFIESTGVQTLNGLQATAYCRIRYTTGGDFRRAQRQREVLSKMIQKAQTAGLGTINDIINAVMEDISTDFTLTELVALASQLFNYQLVDTAGFPYEVLSKKLDGPGWVDIPCDLVKNVTEMHEKLFNDYSYTPSNTVQSYSQEIVSRTGVSVGDEETLTLKEENYANGGSSSTDSSEGAESDTDSGTAEQ